MCSTLAMAQTNQYFWAGGRFIMGNPIDQIDSITFGQLDDTDSIMLYLPHTIKVVHDTVIQYVTIHDTINPCAVPEGAISGKFSVSDTKQVYFSQGNLQYQASTDTWRFAENQYDYICEGNANLSATYDGWIDLFGWSTGSTYFGVSTSQNENAYSGDFVDWGVNMNNEWRTLSNSEWEYLLSTRSNASQLLAVGAVNGINGLIILPDDWYQTPNITFNSGFNNNPTEYPHKYDRVNTYTLTEWEQIETMGAVFLPASGYRMFGNYVVECNSHGDYHTSTPADDNYVYDIDFYSDTVYFSNRTDRRTLGHSVRLVQDVK